MCKTDKIIYFSENKQKNIKIQYYRNTSIIYLYK